MAPLTPLENLLLKYPKKPWDWYGISRNKFNGRHYQDLFRWKKAIENVHEELLYSPYVMG